MATYKVIDDNNIQRIETTTLGSSYEPFEATLVEAFNFASGQIRTERFFYKYQHQGAALNNALVIQNMRDIPLPDDIIAAHNELIKEGKNPRPLSDVLKNHIDKGYGKKGF